MKRRTKIVCTLGPAVNSREKIAELIEAGMNVARINCSHGDWDTRAQWIAWLRELSPQVGPVAILADLQGPKFRLGDIPGGQVDLPPGGTVTVGSFPEATLPIHQREILDAMRAGDRLLIGDGEIEVKLTSEDAPNRFTAKVISAGLTKSRKGVTLVGKSFDVPCLTPKDLEDLHHAAAFGVDYVALSYVKSAADILELKRVLESHDRTIRTCAKIETREAVKDIENILRVVDLVMVARGDMGLQMEIEEVPLAQKHIIQRCTEQGKPVITATQMLESMMVNPRPTRAEATDIANAVLDGTDALMLSGETAAGMHPITCVKTMVSIAEKAERIYDRNAIEEAFKARNAKECSHTEAVAHAVSEMAALLKPKAILTTTTSGQTPRLVSKFRPKTPILCATWDRRTMAHLAVVWGVEAVHIPLPNTTDDISVHAIDAFVRAKRLKAGDTVILTAGVPAGTAGNTNLILTQTV